METDLFRERNPSDSMKKTASTFPRAADGHVGRNTEAASKGRSVHLLDVSFIGTLLFFGLSLLHISFALVGLVCAATPFILHAMHQDKRWCRKVCPRASLFTRVLSKLSLGLRAPGWLFGQGGRTAFLIWFFVNFGVALMSTFGVAVGRIGPLAHARFLMAFPFALPQMLDLAVPDPILHFSYRLFSLMFTSTTIGLLLGLLFKPRSWCAVCPISTLTPIPRKKVAEMTPSRNSV